jgi:FxsC-like protein
MPCEIVTFYSYKGGTGRSMALANVAWILAANQKRVLVIDWDLEAPGLHRYYHPFLEDKELTSCAGIIDFVIDFVAEAVNPSDSQEKDWYVPFADILRYASSLNWDFPKPGTIDFVPAGRQGSDYPTRVNSFDWKKFYEEQGGGVFLEAAKQSMSEYDYVLIDSRTGVSDTSGICTIQMPDTLVVCFTYNTQSIEGAAAVAESALSQRRNPKGEPTLRVFPVPMRVEFSEKAKLDLAKEAARERFNPLLWHMTDQERASYWERVQVNYQPFYAYEETLATFGDKPREPDTLLSRMEVIAEYLTGQRTQLPPLPEDQRLEWRAKFARQPKPVRPRAREADNRFWFYLSYASDRADEYVERFFKDLQEEIRIRTAVTDEDSIGFFDRHGAQETGDRWQANLSALQSSRTMVCLFSPRYFASEYCGREFQIFRSRVELYRQTSLGSEPPAILPVLLTPVGSTLPEAVADIQYLSTEFPRVYAEQGLLYMMRLKKFSDDYQEFVSLLASQLINTASQYELPALETVTSFADTPNAFADKARTPSTPQTVPSQVEFRFVVANQNQVHAFKLSRDAKTYGPTESEWQPFASQTNRAVGLLAQIAAVKSTFDYRTRPVDRDLFKQLEEADRSDVIVILIVDPWSLQLPFFNRLMQEFDSRAFVNCGVLILWDMNDEATAMNRAVLEAQVRHVFSRQLLSTAPQSFRAYVKSEHEFEFEASSMMIALRSKVLARSRLLRPFFGNEVKLPKIISEFDET